MSVSSVCINQPAAFTGVNFGTATSSATSSNTTLTGISQTTFSGGIADDVAQQARALFELHQRNHVGHVACERRVIDSVEDHEAENLAAAATPAPRKIGRETMRAAPRRRKPEFAAGVAARDLEPMRACGLPIGHRFGRGTGMVSSRSLSHHALPRMSVEWQTWLPPWPRNQRDLGILHLPRPRG